LDRIIETNRFNSIPPFFLASKKKAFVNRISFYFKMIVTEMTFHAKLIERGTIIHSNLLLLSIISNTHADMIPTSVAPYIVGHLKSYN
ncbi:hypothetical protein ALC60_01327, partial [Trachymyrmex zeteki]